ncbi:ribonuclease R [Aquisphaera insulae]|uniref:ribonuclease R n=1 Tax=Aquisphaera insulae TaxID=2712864 RepID=UPI0013EBCB82|nr:ribonuclease R [Aquisphaera insulae]
MTDYSEKVLQLVASQGYRPLTLKAMSRRLEVSADDYQSFRRQLKELIRQGRLDVHRDKTLTKPDHSNAVVGIFRRSSRGFGFVRPQSSEGRSEQIYIAPDSAGDASSGDEVVVKIVKRPKNPGMNMEGRIVQILARASGLFVGTYQESGRSGYVVVDGTTFKDPIHVGDPGAKGARPGDKVALEIVRYPTADRGGEGVITELLGPRGAPGVDTLSVIRAFNIPDSFDESVIAEAREQSRRYSEEDISGREDFREVLTVTIDPATARDFDDAISLSRDGRGFWSLGVHIADVSHFVKPSTELDRSARERGTSVYLPDRVIPMLPEVLSNSLASLQAGHVRYTVSALLEFNADGILTAKRFARTAIRVDQRFSYEQAMAVMRAPAAEHEGVAAPVVAMLGSMLELAMILRRRRTARGALDLSLPEVEIELAADGRVQGAHLAVNDESHQVIEEFMIAANEAVAAFLKEHHAAALRRVHAEPDPHKLDQFAEFVRSLGLSLDLPQSRFELQRILGETRGTAEEYAVHFGLLRSMKQAVYTPEHEGHYALASEDYCHFTSPIRRYPDLQVHRQVLAILAGKKPKAHLDELFVLGEHCTRTARRAEAAERELIRVKLLTYLSEKIGTAYHAIVVGVEDFGLFCRLVEFPVEGLVHVTSLADDYYYLEGETHTLIGRAAGRRHRLGDRLRVVVSHVDVDRRVLDLVLEDSRPLPAGESPRRAGERRPLPQAAGGRREARPTGSRAPAEGSSRASSPGKNGKNGKKAAKKARPTPRKGGKKRPR